MMILDVFQYLKNLQKAGFTEDQIEAQTDFVKIQTETQTEFTKDQVKVVQQQVDTINHTIDNDLATKQDIRELDLKIAAIDHEYATKQDIKGLDFKIEALDVKIEAFRSELKAEIVQMGHKITITLASILGGTIMVGVTVFGFLIELH
jgi:uncharacterized protein YktB (UPF0637 family)